VFLFRYGDSRRRRARPDGAGESGHGGGAGVGLQQRALGLLRRGAQRRHLLPHLQPLAHELQGRRRQGPRAGVAERTSVRARQRRSQHGKLGAGVSAAGRLALTPGRADERRLLRGADFREELLQLAAAIHLERDVATADQLALDVQLRIGGPVRVALERIAQLGVLENVEGMELGPASAQRRHGLRREAALGKIRCALHEQHHGTGADLRFDPVDHIHTYLGHKPSSTGAPLGLRVCAAPPGAAIAPRDSSTSSGRFPPPFGGSRYTYPARPARTPGCKGTAATGAAAARTVAACADDGTPAQPPRDFSRSFAALNYGGGTTILQTRWPPPERDRTITW